MQWSEEENARMREERQDNDEDRGEKCMWRELVRELWVIVSASVACAAMRGGADGEDGVGSVILIHGRRLVGGGAGGEIEILNTLGEFG